MICKYHTISTVNARIEVNDTLKSMSKISNTFGPSWVHGKNEKSHCPHWWKPTWFQLAYEIHFSKAQPTGVFIGNLKYKQKWGIIVGTSYSPYFSLVAKALNNPIVLASHYTRSLCRWHPHARNLDHHRNASKWVLLLFFIQKSQLNWHYAALELNLYECG